MSEVAEERCPSVDHLLEDGQSKSGDVSSLRQDDYHTRSTASPAESVELPDVDDLVVRPFRRRVVSESDEEVERPAASPASQQARDSSQDIAEPNLEHGSSRIDEDSDDEIGRSVVGRPRRLNGLLSSDGSDSESGDEDAEPSQKLVPGDLPTGGSEEVEGPSAGKDSDSDVMSSDDEDTFKMKKAIQEAEHSSGDECLEGSSSLHPRLPGSGKVEQTSRSDMERMIRERSYRLPCHRAKKRSLDDFLKRRFSSKGAGSGNYDEEVKKFYSSESSSDDDDDDNDYVPPSTQDADEDLTKQTLEAVAEKLAPTEDATAGSAILQDHLKEDSQALTGKDVEEIVPILPSTADSSQVLLIEESEPMITDGPVEAEASSTSPIVSDGQAPELDENIDPVEDTSTAPKKLTRREKLLNLLKDRLVDALPTLRSESPGVEVDLNDDEGAKEPAPVKNFIESVVHHLQPKQKRASMIPLVEATGDAVTVDDESVKRDGHVLNGEIKVDPRSMLRQALKKRLRAAKVRSKIQSQTEEAEENESDDGEDEEESVEDEDSEESEEEEDDVVIRDKPRKKNAFVDDEAEESDDGDADDESEEDVPAKEEKLQDSEDYPILIPDSEEMEPLVKEIPKKKSLESVTSEDLFDAPDIGGRESACSMKNSMSSVPSSLPPVNRFVQKAPSTDASGGAKAQWRITTDGKLAFTTGGTQDSQEKQNCPLRKLLGGSQTDEVVDLAELCSGTFATQSQTYESQVLHTSEPMSEHVRVEEPMEEANPQQNKRSREEDDGEDDDDDDFAPGDVPKKKRRVCISSDEEEDGEGESEEDVANEEEPEVSDIDEPEVDAGSVMYDSEENEIPVEEYKKRKAKVRNEFFDAEAELSGSDVGSGDENEDDDSDAEAVHDLLATDDGDVPSAAKLRNQIAAIQMKQLQDEDARDIRVLQEMLLQDGDLHSDRQRERRFRWRNVDDDENDDNAPVDEEGGSGGEEEAIAAPLRLARQTAPAPAPAEETIEWRTERLEREKWKTESLKTTNSELIIEPHFSEDSQMSMSAKAMQVIKKLSSVDEVSNSASSQSEKKIARVFKINRKSFLSSTDDDLKRLADLTKSAATPETATSNVPKKGNNFVFAHLSPGQAKPKKRQAPKEKAAEKAPVARPDRSFQKLADDQKQTSIFKHFTNVEE